MHNRTIRKVIVPAAGRGMRLLPATKALPKEIMPVGNKPLIQYAVEEAAASGMEEVILITNGRCDHLEQHFRNSPELEQYLRTTGKRAMADSIGRLSRLARITVVHQEEPRGLAHAIGCARARIDGEPFGVILPDAIIHSRRPCLRQLVEMYAKRRGCWVATREIERQELPQFGVLAINTELNGVPRGGLRVTGLVEKPAFKDAPSRFGIFGRYVLEPAIFDYIDRIRPDKHGELQLTDALNLYCRDRHPVYGFRFEGDHYDAGHKLGFLQANVQYALRDPEVKNEFRKYLASLVLS